MIFHTHIYSHTHTCMYFLLVQIFFFFFFCAAIMSCDHFFYLKSWLPNHITPLSIWQLCITQETLWKSRNINFNILVFKESSANTIGHILYAFSYTFIILYLFIMWAPKSCAMILKSNIMAQMYFILIWLVAWVLSHINLCRLFNAKSIFIQIVCSISNNSV